MQMGLICTAGARKGRLYEAFAGMLDTAQDSVAVVGTSFTEGGQVSASPGFTAR
jgi:hypothetical protein